MSHCIFQHDHLSALCSLNPLKDGFKLLYVHFHHLIVPSTQTFIIFPQRLGWLFKAIHLKVELVLFLKLLVTQIAAKIFYSCMFELFIFLLELSLTLLYLFSLCSKIFTNGLGEHNIFLLLWHLPLVKSLHYWWLMLKTLSNLSYSLTLFQTIFNNSIVEILCRYWFACILAVLLVY